MKALVKDKMAAFVNLTKIKPGIFNIIVYIKKRSVFCTI